ncbi:hypothetical protein Taro_049741 [Colocasia esculenta]|uniref:Uncharacterized protein n=1 Tax=Colocasia esculenta TaxID=4460 RepID=A0A843XBY3_COLES|nr:hypothetical protein [Colocasia esculenta]
MFSSYPSGLRLVSGGSGFGLLIMAPKIDFIDEINPFKETWKIKESNETVELDESIKQGEQITDVDTNTFSITCSSSNITPLKKSIPDNDRGEDLSVDTVPAQHSCRHVEGSPALEDATGDAKNRQPRTNEDFRRMHFCRTRCRSDSTYAVVEGEGEHVIGLHLRDAAEALRPRPPQLRCPCNRKVCGVAPDIYDHGAQPRHRTPSVLLHTT